LTNSTITSNLWFGAILLSGAIALFSACQSAKLPDAGSYPARLYAKRCGACHSVYNPHEMTAAMWAFQVKAMEGRMREAGMPPLTAAERKTILNYLEHNAGKD
jgi:mono/diheme cytochrome c family protein